MVIQTTVDSSWCPSDDSNHDSPKRKSSGRWSYCDSLLYCEFVVVTCSCLALASSTVCCG